MKIHMLLLPLACLVVAVPLVQGAGKKSPSPAPTSVVPSTEAAADRIWIVRPDGAQSCGIKEGQSVEAAAAELKAAGVQVFESRKGNDGMMHMQVCGASTGSLNGHLISRKDLPRAKELGFKEAPKEF